MVYTFYRDEVVSPNPKLEDLGICFACFALDLARMGGPTGNMLLLAWLSGSFWHGSLITMTK
jgi:hypothetical protein